MANLTSLTDITSQLSNISVSSIPIDDVVTHDELVSRLVVDIFDKKRNVCLLGPGGTGKSYISVNVIKKIATERGISIAITSTTGVSALYIGGNTIHRWTGIKLGKEPAQLIAERIKTRDKDCYERWKNGKILVIDEVSMMGSQTLELIDKVGQYVRENDQPFGGIQVIFTGDFLQLPPVNDEFVFKSELWDELNIRYYRLTEPKRYPDKDHFAMLMRIRLGTQTPADIKLLKSRVDKYIDYVGSGKERKDAIKPTRIFSLKKDVEKYNMDELNKLPGSEFIYNSIDRFVKKGKDAKKKSELTSKEILDYTDYLDTLIPRRLYFKPGAQVMLTYNLSVDIGLVNGSRGVVKTCDQDGVTVMFKNGITTKIVFNQNDFDDNTVKMTRYQLPLKLAWGISIHRSQGATLDHAIVDLGSTIFAPGMAYVALSRVRTVDGLLLSNFIESKLYADKEALEFEDIVEANESAEDANELDEVDPDEVEDEENEEVEIEFDSDRE